MPFLLGCDGRASQFHGVNVESEQHERELFGIRESCEDFRCFHRAYYDLVDVCKPFDRTGRFVLDLSIACLIYRYDALRSMRIQLVQ